MDKSSEVRHDLLKSEDESGSLYAGHPFFG